MTTVTTEPPTQEGGIQAEAQLVVRGGVMNVGSSFGFLSWAFAVLANGARAVDLTGQAWIDFTAYETFADHVGVGGETPYPNCRARVDIISSSVLRVSAVDENGEAVDLVLLGGGILVACTTPGTTTTVPQTGPTPPPGPGPVPPPSGTDVAIDVTGVVSPLVLTPAQAAAAKLYVYGTLTANLLLEYPAGQNVLQNVSNATTPDAATNAWRLTAAMAGGSKNVDLPQAQATEITTNGAGSGTGSVVPTDVVAGDGPGTAIEVQLTISIAGDGVGDHDRAIARLPSHFNLTVAEIRAVANAVGGTSQFSLGITVGGAELLLAAAPPVTGAAPTGYLAADQGASFNPLAFNVAYFDAADTVVYLRNHQTVAAATAGTFVVYLAGFIGGKQQ